MILPGAINVSSALQLLWHSAVYSIAEFIFNKTLESKFADLQPLRFQKMIMAFALCFCLA